MNIVYFDIETKKSFQEVGGKLNIQNLGMSIGVTFSTARNSYKIYQEKNVNDFISELQRADLVVGFNHTQFDFQVLMAYTIFDFSHVPSLDLMLDIQAKIGRKISLDSLAEATLGLKKTSEGLQAIKWFKEGKLLEIAEYCCYDVKLTKLLHEFGAKHGKVFYVNNLNELTTVEVNWKPNAFSPSNTK